TTGTPASRNTGTQAASEPSRGQLAPPSASTATPGRTCRAPCAVSNRNPCSSPTQRQRVRNSTPCPRSRASQARNRGDAFIPTGNTRPVEPVNNPVPSPRAQSITCSGPNAPSLVLKYPRGCGGRQPPLPRLNRCANNSEGSALVRFNPDLPAIRNFRAGVGIASASRTDAPPCDRTSAAISPAGPAPMTSASGVSVIACLSASSPAAAAPARPTPWPGPRSNCAAPDPYPATAAARPPAAPSPSFAPAGPCGRGAARRPEAASATTP